MRTVFSLGTSNLGKRPQRGVCRAPWHVLQGGDPASVPGVITGRDEQERSRHVVQLRPVLAGQGWDVRAQDTAWAPVSQLDGWRGASTFPLGPGKASRQGAEGPPPRGPALSSRGRSRGPADRHTWRSRGRPGRGRGPHAMTECLAGSPGARRRAETHLPMRTDVPRFTDRSGWSRAESARDGGGAGWGTGADGKGAWGTAAQASTRFPEPLRDRHGLPAPCSHHTAEVPATG